MRANIAAPARPLHARSPSDGDAAVHAGAQDQAGGHQLDDGDHRAERPAHGLVLDGLGLDDAAHHPADALLPGGVG